MPKYDDDLPQARRSDYRNDGKCLHFSRKFIEYPEDGMRGKAKYECKECGKVKEMTI